MTFNQVTDVDALVKGGFVSEDWKSDFANNASPFYSFPSFLVREGNPKGVKDWGDLVRDDVKVIFPNPKTSGNARYTYLAATAYAKEKFANDPAKVEEFVKKIFDNVPVFDTRRTRRHDDIRRARNRRRADHVRSGNQGHCQGIRRKTSSTSSRRPSAFSPNSRSRSSIRWWTRTAPARWPNPTSTSSIRLKARRSWPRTATASTTRPSLPNSRTSFPDVRLLKVEDVFGGWEKVKTEQFAEGAALDKIYGNR